MNKHAESSKRYNLKYRKTYTLQLNKKTDVDIIEWMETVTNKSGYLKALIREDMKKDGL